MLPLDYQNTERCETSPNAVRMHPVEYLLESVPYLGCELALRQPNLERQISIRNTLGLWSSRYKNPPDLDTEYTDILVTEISPSSVHTSSLGLVVLKAT